MRSVSIEDYIKTIYRLEVDHERATTQRIAQQLNVRMASVTGMIKHLAAEGYLRHKPYYGVKLTEKGRKVALTMIRRHRLIELFLHRTLGLDWAEVHEDAEHLEHAVSDHLVERIYAFLGQPEFDPHGAPIPRVDGSFEPLSGVAMSALGVDERGRVMHVSDSDPAFLRYLTSIGLKLGSAFRVADKAPFDGPLTLRVKHRKVIIGHEAARRILVARTGAGRANQ
ncbi:MAG: transcriptional regulator [Phycisphaerae bacterium]|jgi:DtxR family Mn-dependent transcriptional regulator